MVDSASQGQARNEQPATVPAADPMDVSSAARLLAQRRSDLRTQAAPTEEATGGTPPEVDKVSAGLEDSGDSPEPDQEASSEEQAEPETTEPVTDDDAVLELDGAEIPLSEIRQWRDGAMRAEDYQRKTQAISQSQAAIAAQEQELTKFGQYVERVFHAQIGAAVHGLEAYRNVDWGKLAETDPAKYNATKAKFEVAKGRWEQINRDRQQFLAEYDGQVQRSIALRAEAALPEIRQRIKGWNNAMYNERMEFVSQTYRVPTEFVAKLTDPWLWEMANDAFAYRKGQALPKLAAKVVRKSPKVSPRPGAAAPAPITAEKRAQEGATRVSTLSGSKQLTAAADILTQRRLKATTRTR